MNKVFWLSLFFDLFLLQLFAQGNNVSHKKLNAGLVYSKIVDAFGDGRKPPELKFVEYSNMKDSIVAAFVPGDAPYIEIEELAYDVCMSFGKDSLNALACVLGHELSHYYLKHDWCSNFSKRLSHISLAADLYKSDQTEQLKKESEADYHGFFFGSIAGYRTFDIAPALLKKIYSTYKLNPNLKGYPSLNKRIEAATQSKGLVLRRLPVFEAGMCLFEIGEFELAFDCFNNLLTDFTSRENYNNAAVCKLQMALQLFEPYEMPFCFPFEIDYESRILSGNNRYGTLDRKDERRILLADAKKLLEECIRKDPDYPKAKVNLTICYILLENIDMAAGIVHEMDEKSGIEKSILLSIISAKRGDLAQATEVLNSINDVTDNYTANYNRKLYEHALQHNLKIGDDELGYQVRKAGKISSSNPNYNEVAVDKISCFDSTSKALNIVSDSIQFSSATLYFIKGNRNYSQVIKVKPKQAGSNYYIYKSTELNSCFGEMGEALLFVDRNNVRYQKQLHYSGSYFITTKP